MVVETQVDIWAGLFWGMEMSKEEQLYLYLYNSSWSSGGTLTRGPSYLNYLKVVFYTY